MDAGQGTSFVATVSGAAGAPTGTVTFIDNFNQHYTIGLNASGQASLPVSIGIVGTLRFCALYDGDAVYSATDPVCVDQVVNKIASVVTLSASPSTQVSYGQPLTLRAAITGAINGGWFGTVSFYDGADFIGSAPVDLDVGAASIMVNNLSPGAHTVTATYGGNSAYLPGSASIDVVVVGQAAVNLVSARNPMLAGEGTGFAATVTGTAGIPTGTVTFTSPQGDHFTLGLDAAGEASLSVSIGSAGVWKYCVRYDGNRMYAPTTDVCVDQVVYKQPSTTALTASPSTTVLTTQSVTIQATVSSAIFGKQGPITFADSGVQLGGASVDVFGAASFPLGFLPIGTHNITAQYGGNIANEPSSSAITIIVSGPPQPPVTLSAAAWNGQATVHFAAPSDDGGSAITQYVVTSSPGGLSATGFASPLTVTGLTNGISYTFTAVAVNAAGTSATSAPSNAVVPVAPHGTTPAAASIVFASDYSYDGISGAIWRVHPDGTDPIKLRDGLVNVRGIAVDQAASKLYYVEDNPNRISRMNLDGSGLEQVVVPPRACYDIKVTSLHIYCSGGDLIYRIKRSDLTTEILPIGEQYYVLGMMVDEAGGKLYWVNLPADDIGSIYRANLDGSGRETLVTGRSVPNFAGIDTVHGYLYWTEGRYVGNLMRASLDGSAMLTLIAGERSPAGLALDLGGGEMFWAREDGNSVGASGLDGGVVQTVLGGLARPFSVAVFLGPETGATPTGSGVTVKLETTTTTLNVLFTNVSAPGQTTITSSPTGAPPPEGFKLGQPPVYYDVSTTASFTGPVTLCFGWAAGAFNNPKQVRLMHLENGQWRDVTTSVDWSNRIVCGTTSSLSPFILVEYAYRFAGFDRPISNMPTVNSVKAGSAVPVKFSLGGNFGLDVFKSGYPGVQSVVCDSASPVDPVLETVAAGNSGLTYDSLSAEYTYVWKTDKGWAGSCKTLMLLFNDGSAAQTASFQFTK